MTTPAKATVAKSNSAGEISQADAKFFLACLQSFGDDKQIDLTKVADTLGYTNVASVGNRFRALRKRHVMNNVDARTGSGVLKGAYTMTEIPKQTEDKETEATEEIEAKEDSEPELPTPVKPKAKKAAPRKGAKTTSKPVPAAVSSAKGRKRGAKSATTKAVSEARVKEGEDAEGSMEDNGNNSSSGMDIAAV
ncbi:hypothetical protein BO94DRAFT_620435 [Aspergillus sclerotioniger CBS 115572]|uniref:Myb-like DNA-binding domain-containing protein n=1 Tax=Aspergillus sclerotioniger CBS 115572 TaxID=1450535 RepID=A0A317XDE6_9EURO|nr:hypothetical protein BO94DRAFT_620435 [Aspergillus sclerotioniger CBS 115572]PWY94928.1 hypothetical protein BO94DRAFT_620435 [Aspergillus sclerotioniger CBS 115572]